jgi:hypothetical protein
VGGVGGGEGGGSFAADGGGVPVVEVGRGVQADPGVAVVVVVPGQERLAVRPGGLEGAEPGGEPGPVFQGLELRLGVRVVIAHIISTGILTTGGGNGPFFTHATQLAGSVLAEPQDGREGFVDPPLLVWADPAHQIAQSSGVDRADLLN